MEVCIRVTTPKKTADLSSARGRGTTVIESAGEALQAATLRPIWQRCPRPKILKRTQATMLRPLPGGTTKVALPDPPRAKLVQ
jgi:hypothetical protein